MMSLVKVIEQIVQVEAGLTMMKPIRKSQFMATRRVSVDATTNSLKVLSKKSFLDTKSLGQTMAIEE